LPRAGDLPIAPSTYHEHAAKRADPAKLSTRAKRDVSLKVEVRRVFAENFEVYGVRKVWRQLRREGFDIARCTVERLMRSKGIRGVARGKPVRTTVSDKAAPCPLDHVKRQFQAPRPNVLWVSDFTYVATWQGFVYVAFVIDTFAAVSSAGVPAARRIRALSSTPWSRRCTIGGPFIAAGSCITATESAQYVAIKYTERLAEAGIEPSVGSVGNSYDCEFMVLPGEPDLQLTTAPVSMPWLKPSTVFTRPR
jgi:transposase InsO family protein